MAHASLDKEPRGVIARVAQAYSRRRFGQVVEPGRAASHHAGVLAAMGAVETAAELGWKKLSPDLRTLAVQEAASLIGCSWCVDYGYYEGVNQGVDPAKVRAVATWRESSLFSERERAVLEYAEQATLTPARVSDELAERLHAHFSEAEMVELAAWVALENFRSRFNAGLGLRSEGFAEKCDVAVGGWHGGCRWLLQPGPSVQE